MQSRLLLAGVALGACLISATASHAATITGSFADWLAHTGSYTATTNTGLPLYSTVTTVPLSNGVTLTLAGSDDTLLQPLSGWGPWSGGYTGDIVDSTTNSETISFSNLTAFGFEVSPDLPLFGPFDESFTVTLSDGTTTTLSGDYPAGTTQFIGFYDAAGISSITISAANAPDFAFGNFATAASVPEPASIALLGAGLTMLGMLRRRNRA